MNASYQRLMMEYASGSLDEAYSLAIATHVSLNKKAQATLGAYESIGGALLSDCCGQTAMAKDALYNVLQRIDRVDVLESGMAVPVSCEDKKKLPLCLRDYVGDPQESMPWKKLYPGLRSITLPTQCTSKAELMKIEGGTFIPEHSHEGFEVTLILDGAFHDQGRIFERGDLIVNDNDITHKPHADKDIGCMCLIVTSAPLKMTGLVGKILGKLAR